MFGPYQDSKRKARVRQEESRRVSVFGRDLARLTALAREIRDETHFRDILADIPNIATRAETAKLLEPLLSFPLRRIELVGTPPWSSSTPLTNGAEQTGASLITDGWSAAAPPVPWWWRWWHRVTWWVCGMFTGAFGART